MTVALEIATAQRYIIPHVTRQFSSCFEVEEEIKVVVFAVLLKLYQSFRLAFAEFSFVAVIITME